MASAPARFDGVDTFRTSRTLAHPPAAVFAAFADGASLARWWGPSGFRNTFQTFDFRSGGEWVFTMHGPDGRAYPNHSRFETVQPPTTVVIRHHSEPQYRLTVAIEAADAGARLTWEQRFDRPGVAAGIRHIVEPANEQNLDRLQAELAGQR